MSAAATALFILFQVTINPDGTRSFDDVAVTGSEGVCKTIAAELNASPRKSPRAAFGCRPAPERA